MTKNIYRQQSLVHQEDRQQQADHKNVILWFTGLSQASRLCPKRPLFMFTIFSNTS